MSTIEDALDGKEWLVNSRSIERNLADLWKAENAKGDDPVIRAALWNVIAHTGNDADRAFASDTLSRVSQSVPQRSLIIRSAAAAESDLVSWISANCLLSIGEKQVCSEEISIVAGGERIHHVPSLVNALLLPDVPVAAWWLGDLPSENESYITSLLEPVDHLIFDSVFFDSLNDLKLVARIGSGTNTSPADLNWVRLEEWRVAIASIFDPPSMRSRLRSIRSLRIVSGISTGGTFGEGVESLYLASWMSAQLRHTVDREGEVHGDSGRINYRFERRRQNEDVGAVSFVEISFDDGSTVSIERHPELGALRANVDGAEWMPSSVTRTLKRAPADLIVRQLSRTEEDPIFRRVLDLATRLGNRMA